MSEANIPWKELTNTEGKMVEMLLERDRSRKELHTVCGPSTEAVVYRHINSIRNKLNPRGLDVASVNTGKGVKYRITRLLASANDGRK